MVVQRVGAHRSHNNLYTALQLEETIWWGPGAGPVSDEIHQSINQSGRFAICKFAAVISPFTCPRFDRCIINPYPVWLQLGCGQLRTKGERELRSQPLLWRNEVVKLNDPHACRPDAWCMSLVDLTSSPQFLRSFMHIRQIMRNSSTILEIHWKPCSL